ncbi:MAG TPA: GWxTD domain-containing protein [Acidobacteriota bacterium]|nr:GWxTD domain-containing protein [Acidobacteriota bacterium]
MSKKTYRRTALLMTAAFLLSFFAAVGAAWAKDDWYTQHYIIMQDWERKAYKSLSSEGKVEFQTLFWESRDPKSKQTFDARMEFITQNYKRENSKQPWNTDRGRYYLLNGSPAAVDYDQNTNWGSLAVPGQSIGTGATSREREDVSADRAEIWTYPYNENFIKYVFIFETPNRWVIISAQVQGSRYRGEFENYQRTVVYGVLEPEQYKERIAALKNKKK